MHAVVQDVKSVAASGTATYTINLPSTGDVPQSITVGLAVKYAAVAGTSGIQAAFQISDDGTNFVNAAETNITVAPAATVLGYSEKKIAVAGPLKLNTQPIIAVKVNLTNLDGTNAGIVAVVYDESSYI